MNDRRDAAPAHARHGLPQHRRGDAIEAALDQLLEEHAHATHVDAVQQLLADRIGGVVVVDVAADHLGIDAVAGHPARVIVEQPARASEAPGRRIGVRELQIDQHWGGTELTVPPVRAPRSLERVDGRHRYRQVVDDLRHGLPERQPSACVRCRAARRSCRPAASPPCSCDGTGTADRRSRCHPRAPRRCAWSALRVGPPLMPT